MWARLSIFLAFTECANSMQTENSRLHTFIGCLEKGLIDQAHLSVKLSFLNYFAADRLLKRLLLHHRLLVEVKLVGFLQDPSVLRPQGCLHLPIRPLGR